MRTFALTLTLLGGVAAVQRDSLLVMTNPGDAAGHDGTQTIKDTNVASYISHAMGVLPPAGMDGFLTGASAMGGLFNKPKGNLVLNIEGLGPDMLEEFGSSASELIGGNSDQMRVRPTVNAGTAESSLITSMTGRPAEEAGGSVADILSQTFQGKPLVISASHCADMANAASVHESLTQSNWNTATVKFANGAYQSTSPAVGEELGMTGAELAESMQGLATSLGAKYDQGKWVVPLGDSSVQFDMATSEDAAFFHELAMALHTMEQLKTSSTLQPLVADETPDLLTLSISTFQDLVNKYGRSSPQVAAAFQMLQAAVPALLAQHRELYPNRAAAQLLLKATAVATAGSRPARRLSKQEPAISVNEIALFQVTLWTCIALALAACVGSCALFNMEYESDTLLFQKQKVE